MAIQNWISYTRMAIKAQIVCDSVNEAGVRLTTFQLRYPRYIHSEVLTHRMFSRNASSSRAIPVKKLIEDVRRDPVYPIHWGKNQPGMQAREELEGLHRKDAETAWRKALNDALSHAQWMVMAGAHKQIVNRILEPFAHINVVVTATEWDNFFALRYHPDAQPEIQALAKAMYEAMQESLPKLLKPGEWHLPYIEGQDWRDAKEWSDDVSRSGLSGALEALLNVSAARCARTSYLTFEGKRSTLEEDLRLCEKLIGSDPKHASPFEHQATPDSVAWSQGGTGPYVFANPYQHGNFRGWRQYRKMLPNENIAEFRPG